MAGFFDGLYESTQNPLFLGGIGMMTGGFEGMQSGMQTGAGLQDRLKKQKQQSSFIEALKGMPGVDQNTMAMLAANPELGQQVAGNMISHRLDPMADVKRKTAEANLAQTQQENGMFDLKRQHLQAQIAQAGRGGETPSNVREWQYFQTLPPDQQQKYLSMKRAEKQLDLGTAFARPDPLNPGQVLGTIQKDLVGAERDKQLGEMQGKQEASAPSDLAAADTALETLSSIRGDKNRSAGTGFSSIQNKIWATPGYDFQNKVNQATSGAFLTAIQQMRGLGSLSNSEGQTATAAVTRMNTATSEDAFLEALDDYEKIVRKGRETAARRINEGAARPVPTDGWQTLPGGIRIREKR